MGRRPSAVATLVERRTRYLRLVALPKGLKAVSVRKALVADLNQVPFWQRRSLTWDRGREMADHARLSRDTGCRVYFCDPSSPWQRGTNENTNRLLRQYLPRAATSTATTRPRSTQSPNASTTDPAPSSVGAPLPKHSPRCAGATADRPAKDGGRVDASGRNGGSRPPAGRPQMSTSQGRGRAQAVNAPR